MHVFPAVVVLDKWLEYTMVPGGSAGKRFMKEDAGSSGNSMSAWKYLQCCVSDEINTAGYRISCTSASPDNYKVPFLQGVSVKLQLFS